MSEICIRRANADDIAGIAALWSELLAYHASFIPDIIPSDAAERGFAELLPARLDDEETTVLVALAYQQLIGYGMAQVKTRPPFVKNRRYGFISDLAVTESHRRRGIGTTLLKRLLTDLNTAGISRVEVGVQAGNSMGLEFWQKHGFDIAKYTMAYTSPIDN